MRGLVSSVEGRRVLIAFRQDSCAGCPGTGCGRRSRLVAAENRENLPLKPGQLVETAQETGAALRQGILALIPPAAGFAAGFVLAGLVSPEEGARAAGGVLLMAVGAAVCCLLRRRFPPREKTFVSRIL
jgi:positive regulator of sigma E activity